MTTVKQHTLALISSFVAAGLLAGCGGTQTPAPENASSGNEEVKEGPAAEKGLSGSAAPKLAGG